MQWTFINAQGSPPSHRDFHTAVAVDNRMYVFGGRGDLNSPYNSQEEIYCPQVYYLDIIKEKWVTVNPIGTWPAGRRSHSACKKLELQHLSVLYKLCFIITYQ
jgi:N-acetylneuraminic acid mutarotase